MIVSCTQVRIISLAPDPALTVEGGEANCLWVIVGLCEGGREELRNRLVILEGAGGEATKLAKTSGC